MIKDRRVGIFKVHARLLDDAINTGHGANIFQGMVPLDIRREWYTDTVFFTAWHPQFDQVLEGQTLPEYIAEFRDGADTPIWVKVA